MPENAEVYIPNGQIEPHWLKGEDRFWFRKAEPDGSHVFIIVNASNGRRVAAFDHALLASNIRSTGRIDAGVETLPFTHFEFLGNKENIRFALGTARWQCSIKVLAPCQIEQVRAEVVSPDGRYAAFLSGDNLWIRDRASNVEFELTNDGRDGISYAAPPRLVTALRERLDRKPKAPDVSWSPDSRYLLTTRLNEQGVRRFSLLQRNLDATGFRPFVFSYPYALPGDEHTPVVAPIVFDVERRTLAVRGPEVPAPVSTPLGGWWRWTNIATVNCLTSDRYARTIELLELDARHHTVKRLYHEASQTLALTNAESPYSAPQFRVLSSGDLIIYSDRTGWGHLYYFSRTAGKIIRAITRGQWTVREIVQVDETRHRIYFTAGGMERGRDPYQQYLYVVDFNGGAPRLLTPEDADHGYDGDRVVSVNSGGDERRRFSPSGKYFLDIASRPDLPPTFRIRAADGKLIATVLETGASRLSQQGYLSPEPFRAVAADGHTPIYGTLFRPSTFDAAKSYAIVDSVYPGPQSTRVRKDFVRANFDREDTQALAELGFVVVTIDGRGTPLRSKSFLLHSYGDMSRASDLDDHVAVIRQLARRYPYLDLNRVGIVGASAGGYAAAYGMLKYPNFYKVGVAASGTHDLRGYISLWGETYNGPDRVESFEQIATPALVQSLEGKLLLIHGELDDNVHPGLTMQLVDALVRADKDFELLIVPGAGHDVSAMPYVRRRKWDFLIRNLLGVESPSPRVGEAHHEP